MTFLNKILTAGLILCVPMFMYSLITTFGFMLGMPLLLGTPGFLFLLINPLRSLTFGWYGLALFPMLLRMYLGGTPYYVFNELVVVLVWGSWMATFLIEKGSAASVLPKPLGKLAFSIFAVSLLSAIANRVNPLYWVEWVFTYLLPIPVLDISRRYMKNMPARRIVRVIIWFCLFQFLLNITWHLGVNPLRTDRNWVDMSCGSYGNTAATAYLFIAAVGGGLCYYASRRMALGQKILVMFLFLIAFLQIFFAFVIHAYVFLPLVAVLPVLFSGGRYTANPVKISIKILLVVMAILVFLLPFNNKIGMRHRDIHSPVEKFTHGVWSAVWHGPKGAAIRRIANEARGLQIVVGMGPNAGVSYTGFLLQNPQTMRLVGDWYYTMSGREELSTGSIRENIFSGTAMLFSEIGILGMVLYYGLLIVPLWHMFRRVRRYRDVDPDRLFLTGGVFLLLIMNIVVGLVWDIWRIRMLSMTMWLLLGCVWDAPEGTDAALNDGTANAGK